MALSFKK
jgi:deoxyribonuclease-4